MKTKIIKLCVFFCIFYNYSIYNSFADENFNQELESIINQRMIGEELIDAAIMHCQKGEDLNKNILLQSILDQLLPPNNIKIIIQRLIEKDCSKYASNEEKQPASLFILLSGGYDSNVNQGIASRNVTFYTTDYPITLELGDNYLPQSSSFTEFGIIKDINLSDDLFLKISSNAKKYEELSNYSYASTNISLVGKISKSSQHSQWFFDKNDIWMDGSYYLNTFSLGIQHPINSDPNWQFSSSLRKKNYTKEKAQNSLSLNIGSLKYFNWSNYSQSSIGLFLLLDKANNPRPGGDRKGWNFSASHLLGLNNWILKWQYQRQQWKTESEFSPYLIPEKRRNQSSSLIFSAQYPLSDKKFLLAEIQRQVSNDNIVLYNYKKWNFGLTLVQSL